MSMRTASQLQCLGTWTDISSNYTFSILTDDDDMWPKLWMLRVPSSHLAAGTSFKGYLSSVIATNIEPRMTPEQEVDFVYALQLSPTSFGSLCADEASGCTASQCGRADYAGQLSESYCQKTCNVCRADAGDTASCSFITGVRGLWLDVSGDLRRLTRTISVGQQVIQFDSEHESSASSICVNLSSPLSSNSVGLQQRFPVVTIYPTTGCRPRYSCVELVRHSQSVLTYRVGQTVQWTYHSMYSVDGSSSQATRLSADVLCDDAMFKSGEAANSATQKRIVIRTEETSPLSTVQCDLPLTPGWLLLNGQLSNGQNRTAAISQCNGSAATDQFTYVSSLYGDEDDQLLVSDVHRCLGAFSDSSTGDQYIATVARNEYYCWLFQRRPWNANVRLYVTRVSDCNVNTGSDIQYHGYTGYLASFDVVPPADQLLWVAADQNTLSVFSSHNCSTANFTAALHTKSVPLVSSPVPSHSTSAARGDSGQYPDTTRPAMEVGAVKSSGKSGHMSTENLNFVLVILATLIIKLTSSRQRI